MASTATQTAKLEKWFDVEDRTEWPTLLVGNGASVNLWGDFAYPSLYERANLSAVAEAVFSDLGVTNFETVLEAIHHAHVVVEALGNSTKEIDAQYEHVRDALFGAVHDVHVGWSQFTDDRFDKIASVIQDHDAVYTTNYDVCMYWARVDAVNRITRRTVIDFFWSTGHTFDSENVEVRGRTAMYHLHGAIHLWQDDRGNNGKWTSANDGNLLSLARNYSPGSSKWPLFVSEGSSRAKLQTIGRSPYLSFCLDSLRNDHHNTVVFGHSLGEQDKHIVAALNEGDPREVAVSIYPRSTDQWIIQEKARITELLGENKVRFFDSTTHPLGDPSLTIQKSPSQV
ncbi:DUF4917 family protein [Lentzea indica]|uniref:DUF4917 family protein n=1 Tax=Lentzea indica TaxID=2604800 RepID=UPI00143A643B|nr:DUF4917 family protein [Lentzea indica]